MRDTLDDLAAFLMHRTADTDIPEGERLSIYVLVGAYQEQDDPPTVAAALRAAARAFIRHPDYRSEWTIRTGEEDITIDQLIASAQTYPADTPCAATSAE